MNLVHLVGSLESRYGGPSRSVRRLAEAAADHGDVVELLASSAAGPATVEVSRRLTVRTWPRRWPGAFCRVPEMAAHLARLDCDIVHHHGLWLRPLHYAHQHARRVGIPLVVSPRGMMSPWAWRHHRLQKKLAARWLHPGAMSAVAGWHVTSPTEADEVRALGFTQPICAAPNGVDAPSPADLAAARAHWQNRVEAAATHRVAVFHSRFHEKKRVLELIELWGRQAPEGWTLLMVGVPEQYSVDRLREHARRAAAGSRIEIHDGTEQPPPYAAGSLFLLPSHSENFGLVIAEAMAHGIPVMVTDATPWATLNSSDLGWCVPWAEFPAALARVTAEPPEALRARGARAREWVLREFSWERAARELAEFYRTLPRSRR